MPIMHIRQLIREILLEDFESWKADATEHAPVYFGIQTSDMPNKERAQKPRDLKRMWNKHADHQFFSSLTKVHWLSAYLLGMQGRSPTKMIKDIVKASGKDELATMGYLPGTKLETSWGEFGVLISGRTTLAANDMDELLTGEHPGSYGPARKKWKSSGIPRRASSFHPDTAGMYILDRDSFQKSGQGVNELVVDNWKAVGFVIPKDINRAHTDLTVQDRRILKVMKDSKLPVYDNTMAPADLDVILADYQ
jgi:hypothetical protein